MASLLCGLAGDPTLLNLARGLQGCGAAAMFATALALIAQEFEGRERATAIGIWGATVGGAVAIGPLVGGVLTEHLGWEWIFFVNVPIGIGALVLTETKLVNVKASDPQPIDWIGVFTFSPGAVRPDLRPDPRQRRGLGEPADRGLAGRRRRADGRLHLDRAPPRHAMLDLSLFRKKAFTGVSIVAFALSAGMFAMFLYMTLYIQGVLGYSPLEAGLRFLPLTLLSFIVAPLTAKFSDRIPARVSMGTGLTLVGIGLILMGGISVGDTGPRSCPASYWPGSGSA